ncbi:hypothetical protein A2881_00155 [Candidatus Peribacteria bacterium RIFCSPHIGHO2_01_FULL_55_13]|nr:MAG: hypothetical protein A2881_00155 [Candidatus Peribacteria bacterium RIFCSPHIGHO2_01_FULL_55_13]OGJ65268.1 MAG: hypothetical protein A3F36_00305 [Candidatus Peribacteria bacterium RIFCSPHIGHO2_12_FULL_55_11]
MWKAHQRQAALCGARNSRTTEETLYSDSKEHPIRMLREQLHQRRGTRKRRTVLREVQGTVRVEVGVDAASKTWEWKMEYYGLCKFAKVAQFAEVAEFFQPFSIENFATCANFATLNINVL